MHVLHYKTIYENKIHVLQTDVAYFFIPKKICVTIGTGLKNLLIQKHSAH
jgi:hypothetical protein